MSSRQIVALTARREIAERVRSRAFRASTGVQVLIVLVIVVISALTADDGPSKATINAYGPDAGAASKVITKEDASFDIEVKIRTGGDERASRASVRAGDIDGSVGPGLVLVGPDAPDVLAPLLENSLRSVQVAAELQKAGVPADRAQAVLSPGAVKVEDVDTDSNKGKGIAFVGALILYIALISYGYVVASGVVEEKSTRVVEVILSAIKPRQLLTGKLFGIGILGVLQLALIGGVGVGAALISGQVDLPSTTGVTLALSLLYFVLGYAFYACAFAMAGAIVSRQEDVQSTTTPLTTVLIASYLVAISVVNDPDSTLATVCTFIPPVAPMVVPARAAGDALPLSEFIASVALMLAGIALLIYLAGRIYERAVLRMGTPLKIRQAFRLLRSDGS